MRVTVDFRTISGASGVLLEDGFKACLPSANPAPVLSLSADRIETRTLETYRSPDLASIEGAEGHTIRRHVAQSDTALRERALRTHHDVSSFSDTATAQRTVDAAFAENQGRIAAWMSSRTWSHLDVHVHFSETIGRVYRYDRADIESTPNAEVILERRPAMPQGYTVITAYPSLA
jgi:hypothetical protein